MKLVTKLLLALMMLSPTFSFAQDVAVPTQTIQGAEKPYQVGDLVKLKLTPLDKTKVPNLASVGYSWKVRDDKYAPLPVDKFVILNNNAELYMGTGNKVPKYFVTVTSAYTFITKDGEKITNIYTVVQDSDVALSVDGFSPTPQPKPNPPVPGPDDAKLPDGQYKLAQFTYDLASNTLKGDLVKAAPVLSKSFKTISTKIAAGAITKPLEALQDLANENRKALNEINVPIEQVLVFTTPLEDKLYSLYKETKTLRTMTDFATGFDEVSQGLAKVK